MAFLLYAGTSGMEINPLAKDGITAWRFSVGGGEKREDGGAAPLASVQPLLLHGTPFLLDAAFLEGWQS